MNAVIFNSSLVKNNKGCGDMFGARISTNFESVEDAFEDMKLSCEYYLVNVFVNLSLSKKRFSKNYKFNIYKTFENNEELVCEVKMEDIIKKLKEGFYDKWFKNFHRANRQYIKFYTEFINL